MVYSALHGSQLTVSDQGKVESPARHDLMVTASRAHLIAFLFPLCVAMAHRFCVLVKGCPRAYKESLLWRASAHQIDSLWNDSRDHPTQFVFA